MADHKQGCPALPGYGHAPEACTCGAEPTESFDAVLAEVDGIAQYVAIHYPEADDALHDRIMQAKARLQSAHEAEVAERDGEIRMLHILNAAQAVAITDNADDATLAESRADRAVGLLRECRAEFAGLPRSLGYDFTHLPEIDAFLSEQAGERENGDG